MLERIRRRRPLPARPGSGGSGGGSSSSGSCTTCTSGGAISPRPSCPASCRRWRGLIRFNPIDQFGPAVAGERRPGDERFDVITARRPVMESVAVAHAEATDGITIRRGTAVAGLLTAGPQTGGAPRVTGVLTGDGDTIAADLVVDATGRRSGLPRLLAAIGAAAP